MSEYYCSNCDTNLEKQSGFYPNTGYWTCEECGQLLLNPEDSDSNQRYTDVGWFCDNCGTFLNGQTGFSDWDSEWVCMECGYANTISETEIYDSCEEYQSIPWIAKLTKSIIKDFTSTQYEYQSYDNYDDDDDDKTSEVQEQLQNEYKVEEQKVKTEKRNGLKKRIWRTLTRKKLNTGISSNECRNMNYEELVSIFKEQEFDNINLRILEDLNVDNISREGMVQNITINNKQMFDSNTMFPFNAKIIITYHMLKKQVPPLTSKTAKGKNIDDVEQAFSNAGFVNIERRVIFDLTIGWIVKENSVEAVTINGESNFRKTDTIRLDSHIVISYHTFKNKKGKL